MKIAIVTLAFNNPTQVRRTLASVALQNVAPDRYIVVDGSSPNHSREIQKYSAQAGAEYFWKEPRGVYPAMNDALNEISPEAFVWFVNSSDWLASPESISMVKQQLNGGAHWVIGGLHRYRDRRMPFHPSPRSGEAFVVALSSGEIGFPHPSAIMSKAGIHQCGGFDESYQIAGDYALAVKFAQAFGAPQMIPGVLAIHDPTGLTSQHRARHYLEKVRARKLLTSSPLSELTVLARAAGGLGSPVGLTGSQALEPAILQPFAAQHLAGNWPESCLDVLDAW